ncbi:MAG: nucleotidyl transferase AbiEii/AbiGii toxin family protein [Acidobacteria bacterium]|nr:nucleotidyl transferase AbiEii/AbiGii toxin family protein [Acidobacteriota bacterium]
MTEADFEPERILRALSDAEVRYVLIGGMAAILHGDAGVTIDLDIAPAFDPDNLERLAAALRSLNARIRTEGTPEGVSFDCSGAFLRNLGRDAVLNLTTQAGDIDVAFTPTGTQGFRDLKRDAVSIDAGGITILVASLADIIRSKAAADREKDRRALPRLRTLLERTAVR